MNNKLKILLIELPLEPLRQLNSRESIKINLYGFAISKILKKNNIKNSIRMYLMIAAIL
jgi:hypothetical protein